MSAPRVGKCRYKVPGPTPACLAISSRLASAPDRVKASFATSKMRSRFFWASVRGFRRTGCERFLGISKKNLVSRVTGDSLRLSKPIAETISVLPKSRRFVNLGCEGTAFERANTGGNNGGSIRGNINDGRRFIGREAAG